jgi:hypothetical protein
MKSKNAKVLADFTDYCIRNPEMRFWQALRNWARVANFLVFCKEYDQNNIDTFNWEGKDK